MDNGYEPRIPSLYDLWRALTRDPARPIIGELRATPEVIATLAAMVRDHGDARDEDVKTQTHEEGL